MQSSHDSARAPWLVVLLTLAGCTTTDYPRNLPEAGEAASSLYGSWVVVYTSPDPLEEEAGQEPGGLPLEGELLAVDKDSVFFFAGDLFTACAKHDIRTAAVYVNEYAFDPYDANLWLFLGTLSTASHGIFLLGTAPAWMLFGGLTSSSIMNDADRGDVRWPDNSWESLSAFARYPQGLSGEIDRGSLRPAPGETRPPRRDR